LPESANVSIKIYDVLGNEVKEINEGFKLAGTYKIIWNGDNSFNQNVSSGVYLIALKTDNNLLTHKVILLR
jgi:flagellar hook assembly protein FlgD